MAFSEYPLILIPIVTLPEQPPPADLSLDYASPKGFFHSAGLLRLLIPIIECRFTEPSHRSNLNPLPCLSVTAI
jgi:hypothetical protein